MELKYLDKALPSKKAQAAVKRIYSEMSTNSDFIALSEHIEKGGAFTELRKMIDECAEKYDLNVCELRNTVFVASLESARKNYIKNGTEEMFFAGLSDFGTKTEECFKVCGVYGSRSVEWFQSFFFAQRYTFGRLQYQAGVFTRDEYKRGNASVQNGDLIWYVHIPSNGKLTPESAEASLEAAYRGLPASKDGRQVFVCSTWLFYPQYQGGVFPVGSNVYNFAKLFDIVSESEQQTFKDAWRVFYVDEITDTNELPQDTSLQKRFVEYIKQGGKFGTAMGIHIRDENGRI